MLAFSSAKRTDYEFAFDRYYFSIRYPLASKDFAWFGSMLGFMAIPWSIILLYGGLWMQAILIVAATVLYLGSLEVIHLVLHPVNAVA